MEPSAENDEPLRILLLEDVPTDAELTLRELRKVGFTFESRRVDTRKGFEHALNEFRPDLILSDFSLPARFDGLTALDIARRVLPDIPYVFVSGTIGEDRAVEAMKRGATDYVLKDRLNRLVPVIRRALEERREREARRRAERELEETRSRLDSIVASLSDAVWSVSVEPYRVQYVSRAVEAIWGIPAADIYARPEAWFEPIHRDDRDQVRSMWAKTLAGAPFDASYRVVRGDGQIRWIHDRGTAIRDASGRIVRIDGIAADVTERKRQELKIVRLNRVLAVLSGINSAIVRIPDRQELLEEACRIAVEHGCFRMAWIGLVAPGASKVEPVACAGADEGYLDEVGASIRKVGLDEGLAGRALRDKRAMVANDIETDPRVLYRNEALARGYRSLAVLPLTVSDAVVGVFVLYAAEKEFFDDEETRLLDEIAGDISFALDHIAKTERLDYLAYYDSLTGLPNRGLFQEQVAQLIHSVAPNEQRLALVMLDPERFRNINETLGMPVGDALLKQLADRLSVRLGEPGIIARISADRFAAALAPMRSVTDIVHALEQRIFVALREPFRINDQEVHIPAKAGVAIYPGDGDDAVTLLLNAEAALTRAKQSGERFLFYAPEMNARVAEQLRIENELRKATLEEQFVLHYQPRIDLAGGRICGLEALLRWQHPQRGLVPPADFVSVLEQTGMILDAGRWVIRRAALDCAAWMGKGLDPPRIAVNVSQAQLRRKEFVEDVRNALAAAGASAGRIDIEITESMLMEDTESNIEKLRALRAAGIAVALDDFGTGYSSLSWLARLPIDSLKIDRSFITQMATSPEQMAIVSAVISLARALNLKVVAEGVETEEQVNLLRLLRCDEGQGYHFNPPLPPEKIEALLR